jgi:phosphoribosylformylglycinamidine cyclo-ligase
MGLTYAKSGVNIDEKAAAIAALVKELRFTRKGFGAPVDIGSHFTGLIDFGQNYLSLCTDGVGTKLLVAEALDRWDTVGIDCIAMNANDMICVGAEPLAFVDYIAVDKPRPKTVEAVGRGLSRGSELANLSIIGGETAVVPEMVRGLDLSGTCLGFVKKGRQIVGSAVRPKDVVIGIESSGIHSNGLTLARRVFKDARIDLLDNLPGFDLSVGEELLKPTHIYVRPILELLKRTDIHGLANITGGGLRNLLRLKPGVQVRIERPMDVPPIFLAMQKLGKISHKEMYQIFNMGMGFSLVAPKDSAEPAIAYLARHGLRAQVVGRITRGKGVVQTRHKLVYNRY